MIPFGIKNGFSPLKYYLALLRCQPAHHDVLDRYGVDKLWCWTDWFVPVRPHLELAARDMWRRLSAEEAERVFRTLRPRTRRERRGLFELLRLALRSSSRQ